MVRSGEAVHCSYVTSKIRCACLDKVKNMVSSSGFAH